MMIYRIFGAFLFLAGFLFIAHDYYCMAIGQFDSTIIYLNLVLAEKLGYGSWMAFTQWLSPMITGLICLFSPDSRSPRG